MHLKKIKHFAAATHTIRFRSPIECRHIFNFFIMESHCRFPHMRRFAINTDLLMRLNNHFKGVFLTLWSLYRLHLFNYSANNIKIV